MFGHVVMNPVLAPVSHFRLDSSMVISYVKSYIYIYIFNWVFISLIIGLYHDH